MEGAVFYGRDGAPEYAAARAMRRKAIRPEIQMRPVISIRGVALLYFGSAGARVLAAFGAGNPILPTARRCRRSEKAHRQARKAKA